MLKNARIGLLQAASAHEQKLPTVVIHNEHGGNFAATEWFFSRLLPKFSAFDVIGVSFYPWYQGTLKGLQYNLEQLSSTYKKDVAVVEMAYPWTMDAFDDLGNFLVDTEQLHDGYAATPKGQVDFVMEVRRIVSNTGRGRGIVYWAFDWISVSPKMPSAWENLALFNRRGKALPGLQALGSDMATEIPSTMPSSEPSLLPSSGPSILPSLEPSSIPSMEVSSIPSMELSLMPSSVTSSISTSSEMPTSESSIQGSFVESLTPTMLRSSSRQPSTAPTSSNAPSAIQSGTAPSPPR